MYFAEVAVNERDHRNKMVAKSPKSWTNCLQFFSYHYWY